MPSARCDDDRHGDNAGWHWSDVIDGQKRNYDANKATAGPKENDAYKMHIAKCMLGIADIPVQQ